MTAEVDAFYVTEVVTKVKLLDVEIQFQPCRGREENDGSQIRSKKG